MALNAPLNTQQWMRDTDSNHSALAMQVSNLQTAFNSLPQADKTVYTTGPAQTWNVQGGAPNVPANASVQFVNTSRLVQVTVSGVVTASHLGRIGVGFTLDGADPSTAMAGLVILQGFQIADLSDTSSGTYSGMSFTATIPVTPGVHTAGLFYFNNNPTPGTSTPSCQVYSSTITVKSI